jgi:GNAT superfamily N-acetyltransferase
MSIPVTRVTPEGSLEIAVMVGELFDEIMNTINVRAFNFVLSEADARLKEFISENKNYVFAAIDEGSKSEVGFVTMYESYSIYAEGAFGTIPELYVRPAYRQKNVGKALLDGAKEFGAQRGWTRLEVTTPPIPQFQRTLAFYEREGFAISGGRKLQIGL